MTARTRRWDVFPIVRAILRCSIVLALHGFFVRSARRVLVQRWLIVRQLWRRLANGSGGDDGCSELLRQPRFAAARRFLRAARRSPAPAVGRPRWHRSAQSRASPSGSLKSHSFSARPMKSRIAGSADQARRSAARAEVRRNARLQETRGCPFAPNRFDRRQTGGVERGFRRLRLSPRQARRAASRRLVRLTRRGAPLLGHRACAATIDRGNFPARSSLLVIRRRVRRASASGSARSRLRLTNACSTWCSATKVRNRLLDRLRHRHRVDQVGCRSRSWLRLRPDRRSPAARHKAARLRSAAAPPTAAARRSSRLSR